MKFELECFSESYVKRPTILPYIPDKAFSKYKSGRDREENGYWIDINERNK